MKHLVAFLIKLAFVLAITAVVLMPATGAAFSHVFWIALATTLALYALGDMVILPSWGNMAAVIADAGVALLLTWLAPTYTGIPDVRFSSAVAVAFLTGIAEYYYHHWLQKAVLPGPATGTPGGGESSGGSQPE